MSVSNVMSFFFGMFVGCVVFSIVSAILDLLRDHLTAPKSEYELWLKEAKRNSIIETRQS